MSQLRSVGELGRTGLKHPPMIIGISSLGELFQELSGRTRLEIVSRYIEMIEPPVVFDGAGKYGAGKALEFLGWALRELKVPPEDVTISNKLGWFRIPLVEGATLFEGDVWKNLTHNAEQRISYDGILECYEQGCELLGAEYAPQLVSVHDPDEFLAAATDAEDRQMRMSGVIGAYKALNKLKAEGKVKGVGIGSKDWKVIAELVKQVELDWVMFACSLTILRHPPELLALIDELHQKGVGIVNSAVFNAGFLVGGNSLDYQDAPTEGPLVYRRNKFQNICREYGVKPADACIQFGMSPPGVSAIALNTSKPRRVAGNIAAFNAEIPVEFWRHLQAGEDPVISPDYPHVG